MTRATKRLAAFGLSAMVLALGACSSMDKGTGPYQAPGGADVMNRQGPGDVALPGEATAPKDQSTQGAQGNGTSTGIPTPTAP